VRIKNGIIFLLILSFLLVGILPISSIAYDNDLVSIADIFVDEVEENPQEENPQEEITQDDNSNHDVIEDEQFSPEVEDEESVPESESEIDEPDSGASESSEPEENDDGDETTTENEDDYVEDYIGIEPLITGNPFPIHNLPANATTADWNNAIGTSGDRVISVQGNQTSMPTITISGSRQIIIASSGTNLNNHTRSGTPFTLNVTGATARRHFIVENGATLTLSNIILDGNAASGTQQRGGVLVRAYSHLIMQNDSRIINCHAGEAPAMGPEVGGSRGGGGVRVANNSRLTMENGSIISNNRSTVGSGFRASTNSTVVINGGTISNNTTQGTGHGGGFQIDTSTTATIHNITLTNNLAPSRGGGIRVLNTATLTMHNGTITGNTSNGAGGGGVYVYGTFEMHNGTISGNTANDAGGGVWVTGTFTNHNGIIENNRAQRGGGVAVLYAGNFNMQGGAVRNNVNMPGNNNPIPVGGGVWVGGNANGRFNMSGGTIENNRAVQGGGVFVTNGARAYITNSAASIRNNTATSTATDQGGGGVYATGNNSTLSLTAGVINNNRATRGAGVMLVNGAALNMSGGEIRNHTQNADNDAITYGAGVHVFSSTNATTALRMQGGVIRDNNATNGGGVHITGPASTTVASNATFDFSGGTISHNNASRGGGVLATNRATFNMTTGGTGGIIIGNTATETSSQGGGGGVRVNSGATFEMHTGRIESNISNLAGGGIATDNASFTMHNGVIYDNRSTSSGGGLHARPNSTITINNGQIIENRSGHAGGGFGVDRTTFTMHNGVVSGNTANENGGGIHIWNSANDRLANIQGGTISNNVANNGGGLYIRHNGLDNLTINTPVIFTENTARHGLRVDTPLAIAQRPRIDPGTVSISDIIFIDEMPLGSNIFTEIVPHAFTNHDINSEGVPFWRVTYEAVESGYGEVSAAVGTNNHPVPSNSFIRDGAAVTFTPSPILRFINWEVLTRTLEEHPDGSSVDFSHLRYDTNYTTQQTITAHTHVIGNFNQRSLTTSLTVSKEVAGALGNRLYDFDFAIYFTDSNGYPLPAGTEFIFVGDTIPDTVATAPPDGTLTLNSNGRAMFTLRHGQLITIEDLPLAGNVRIMEIENLNYTTSFRDSENAGAPVVGNDTGMLSMVDNRVIDFINDRFVPPPTGLNVGNDEMSLMIVSLVLAMTVATAHVIYRIKRVVLVKMKQN